ncbi:MAG: hypothetical protein E6Q40_02155 [Cupriavidus sp.]|jgi:hypothetical protein|nr:MAG: hypothetical protein E6Q40_02155 [Cupriavidus sp.]
MPRSKPIDTRAIAERAIALEVAAFTRTAETRRLINPRKLRLHAIRIAIESSQSRSAYSEESAAERVIEAAIQDPGEDHREE